MPVYAIVLDNGTELEIDADSPEIAQKQAVDYGKQSYADASKTDVAAEIGRSVGRGGEYAAEFLADTADVLRAPFDQFVPGFEDNQLLDELNPFGAEGPSDKFRREKIWESDVAQSMTAEKMRRGENQGLDAAKTAAEYVLPAFTGQGFKKAVGEAVVTGGAAALGENVGARYGLGEEGELLAALVGGLGSGKVADAAVAAYRKIKPTGAGNLTDVEIKQVVARIMATVDGPAAQKAAIDNALEGLDSGQAGTLADLTGDADVYNIEAMATKGSKQERGIEAQGAGITDEITQGVEDAFGDASIDSGTAQVSAGERVRKGLSKAKKFLGEKAARVNAVTEKALAASEKRELISTGIADDIATSADDAQAAISSKTPVTEASTALSDELDTAAAAQRARDVQPKWDDFDAQPNINTSARTFDIEDTLLQIEKDLPDVTPDLERIFKTELALLRGFGKTESPQRVHGVISSVKNTLANAQRNNASSGKVKGAAGTLVKRIESLLDNSPASKQYQAARDAESKWQRTFNQSKLGKARAKTENAGELSDTVFPKAGGTSAKTYADDLKNIDDPAVLQKAEDALRAQMRPRINSAKELGDFMRTNEEALGVFPALKKEVQTAIKAQEGAGLAKTRAKDTATMQQGARGGLKESRAFEADKIAAQDKRVTTALDKSLAKRYSKEPDKVISEILNSKDPTSAAKQMDRLVASVGKNAGDKASLKRKIGEHYASNLSKTSGRIDPKVVESFQSNKALFKRKGLMDDDEIAVVEAMLDKSRTTKLRRAAAEQRNSGDAQELSNLGSSMMAAGAMYVLPGSSLIMAGAVRRYAKAQMAKNPDPLVIKGLQEMVDNPERFREALKGFKVDNPDTMGRRMWAYAKAAGKGLVLGPSHFTSKAIKVESGDEDGAIEKQGY